MKFADNLRKIRKSNNISQEVLAEKVGVSRQSVSKWETSEAYPEMNNMLELCKIFHCNINDLVNDKLVDLDSLDEEVKMSVVKFKKEKQKQMKGISNILSLIGKIGGIVLKVFLGFLIAITILLPISLSFVDIKEGSLVSKNNNVRIVEQDGIYNVRIGNIILANDISKEDINLITPAIDSYSKPGVIILLELGIIVAGIFIVCLIKAFKHMELLFASINKEDTPFTIDNVNHIKKMSYLLIAGILLSSIAKIILFIPLKEEVDIDFNILNIIEIFFLYSMSLVFEYGYEIQLDSKGKMYGEE